MERSTAILVGLGVGVGAVAWWFLGDREAGGLTGELRQIFNDAISAVTRGRRLTQCPYNKTTGVAACDPATLAATAGLDLDTYALARMIASEEGGSSTAVQALVAHAVRNHAARSGKSIASILLRAKLATHSGFFGTQRNIEEGTPGYNSSDRYASTATDPYEGHAQIAAGVLSGAIPDLTGGAEQFDRTKGLRDPEGLAEDRMNAGNERVPGLEDIEGIGDLEFWRKVAQA